MAATLFGKKLTSNLSCFVENKKIIRKLQNYKISIKDKEFPNFLKFS